LDRLFSLLPIHLAPVFVESSKVKERIRALKQTSPFIFPMLHLRELSLGLLYFRQRLKQILLVRMHLPQNYRKEHFGVGAVYDVQRLSQNDPRHCQVLIKRDAKFSPTAIQIRSDHQRKSGSV